MSGPDVLVDLLAEQDDLDDLVGEVDPAEWSRPTASPGWSVHDQIAHLAHFDRSAALAIQDPEAFGESVRALLAAVEAGGDAVDDLTLGELRRLSPEELLAEWRAARRTLADAASGLADDDRVPWYGPPMGARSFLTARLMEAWAHGADVAEALELRRTPTDRLCHIAHIGFITRGWSYRNRGLEPPEATVAAELTAPSGETWTFGPEDADEVVRGTAEDFCLVVTQRRHLDDTALTTSGPAARDWLLRAQAFAGPPTDGPAAAG